MAEKSIKWNSDDGSINLVSGGTEERLILMRTGFMEAFFDEIEKVEGKATLKNTFRNLLKRLGASQELINKPDIESFHKFCDNFVLPINYDLTQIPELLEWEGEGREIKAFGNAIFRIVPHKALMMFKEVSAELLTERGAVAIIRTVARKAGLAVIDEAMVSYGWTEMDTAMNSMDGVLSFSLPKLGWGKTRVAVSKDVDGNHMFYLKSWNSFEADNVKHKRPVCVIFQYDLDGIGMGVAGNFIGRSTESREVKCRALGDDYCAFAIKVKDKDVKALDWKELEDEWRALDAVYATPEG